jgi:hypothetical protein
MMKTSNRCGRAFMKTGTELGCDILAKSGVMGNRGNFRMDVTPLPKPGADGHFTVAK